MSGSSISRVSILDSDNPDSNKALQPVTTYPLQYEIGFEGVVAQRKKELEGGRDRNSLSSEEYNPSPSQSSRHHQDLDGPKPYSASAKVGIENSDVHKQYDEFGPSKTPMEEPMDTSPSLIPKHNLHIPSSLPRTSSNSIVDEYISEDEELPTTSTKKPLKPLHRQYSNGHSFQLQKFSDPGPSTASPVHQSLWDTAQKPFTYLFNTGEKSLTIDMIKKEIPILKLEAAHKEFGIVMEYIRNSQKPGPSVNICGVYAICQKSEVHKASRFAPQPYRMLLWARSSPSLFKKLVRKQRCDDAIVFYDRITSVLPKRTKEPTEMAVLLCAVTLGTGHKSPHGFARWQHLPLPVGYDSVKGNGKYMPNWQDNAKIKDIIVPCGETKVNPRFPTYEIDFNEYIVYGTHGIQPLFVVDLVITNSKNTNV